jgi:predicted O-linked N-acetylglucosamine transferase (SPINDLY family)
MNNASNAYQFLLQKQYSQAIALYEELANLEPDVYAHSWYLGLAMLLDGQEVEAQLTWALASEAIAPEVMPQWIAGLVGILQQEAQRHVDLEDLAIAWVIHQHIREIIPEDIANLLQIVFLSVQLKTFTAEDLISLNLIELLELETTNSIFSEIEDDLFFAVWQSVLGYVEPEPIFLNFVDLSLAYIQDRETASEILRLIALQYAYNLHHARDLMILVVKLDPTNWVNLSNLAQLQQETGHYDNGIINARKLLELAPDLLKRAISSHILLRGLLTAGAYWLEALDVYETHKHLLNSIVQAQPKELDWLMATSLFKSNFFFPYLNDMPQIYRKLQNQVIETALSNLQQLASTYHHKYKQSHLLKSLDKEPRPLKIGYISFCLREHSVGWLARWLFLHHDRDHFQIYTYFIDYKDNHDPLQQWYENHSSKYYRFGTNSTTQSTEIADIIYQDQLDILIDLDSISNSQTCEIMALKPSPIQITWLGWDASGLSTIDYFIADPYVLPDNAQDYYQEKIWRLPQTYIAVDGFEIAVSSLRRDQLGIPTDAIVYLSAQGGYKRHIDTVRLQMQVIKSIPNSYFLIKGKADQKAVQDYFEQLAIEEGVNPHCLRFLPPTATEAEHRANLAIADIVLDTYPYNGATTTLETLWMGIPIVTKVGEQFAARNSYTMMINAGITEGIAWTDAEYVEWGIRLGTDAQLRSDIATRLHKSRQTSPLWNAKQFTREMEKAYQQMWQKFVQSDSQ